MEGTYHVSPSEPRAVKEADVRVRKKTTQLRTDGATSLRGSVGALWGPKQLDNLVDLGLFFEVIPEKSVLRRRQECDVGNQYVLRSLELLFFFLTRFGPHWSVKYVWKVSSLSFHPVLAVQGPIASFSSSTGGHVLPPRCKRPSMKFIVHLMPTNPLSWLQTSSCRRVRNSGHPFICIVIGITFCRFV